MVKDIYLPFGVDFTFRKFNKGLPLPRPVRSNVFIREKEWESKQCKHASADMEVGIVDVRYYFLFQIWYKNVSAKLEKWFIIFPTHSASSTNLMRHSPAPRGVCYVFHYTLFHLVFLNIIEYHTKNVVVIPFFSIYYFLVILIQINIYIQN